MTTGLIFKTSLAKTGLVNIQAKPSVATTQVIPVVSLKDPNSFTVNTQAPLAGVVETLKSPSDIIGLPNIFTVLPSYSDLFFKPKPIDTRLDKERGPDVKFSAYEELTGVSKIRPEILLLTNFQPLFDSTPSAADDKSGRKDTAIPGFNAVGEFIDAQIQLQHLRHEAMVKLIADMKQDGDVAELLSEKEESFKFHVSNLTNYVNFLFETVGNLEKLKEKISIKDTQCFSFELMSARYFSFLLKSSTQKLFDVTTLNNLTFQTVLADRGFNPKNVQAFSSTKTFLQTLYEINSLVKGNSYNLLGISPQEQRDDSDPVYINKHVPNGFVFTPQNVSTVELPALVGTTKANVLSNVNSIKAAYDSLFSTTNFQSPECRLAFLFSFLSHEFSFSRCLATDATRTFIRDNFGYPISETFSNAQLFDVVLGDVGDKIIDRTDNLSTTSVSAIANKIVNNVSVLPFEPDYIEFEQSVHTPGSAYFVDTALQLSEAGFNTANMESFSADLDGHVKRFTEFVRRMNFLPSHRVVFGSAKGYLGDILGSSRRFFEHVLYSFVDSSTGQAKASSMASDIPGVFNAATKDNYLKSLLFIYVFLKVYAKGSSTSSQALEVIIKEIDTRLNGSLGTASPFQVNSSALSRVGTVLSLGSVRTNAVAPSSTTRDSISTELKELRNTSEFLNSVFGLFKSIHDSFLSSSGFTDPGFTRFNHVQNVVLMMIIFDSILGVVSGYVPKQFVGQYSSKSSSTIGKTFYTVATKSTSGALTIGRLQNQDNIAAMIMRNPLSINTVKAKLDSEVNSLIKMSFMIISSLASLKDTLDATVKTLKMTETVKQLNTILGVIGDRKLLSLTMTPQQILTIRSMLDDIVEKINVDRALPKSPGNVDFELHGPDRDDVVLLDDAVISGELKTSLLAFLANEKFSSSKGSNVRLLTVGVPSGMALQLKQRVLLNKIDRNTFSPKQVDVVRVNVYKVDVEHQDLIFKPVSFIFELSRFVSRTGFGVKNVFPGMSLEQILDSVPTRDYSVLSRDSSGESRGLDSPDYSFLTSDQKKELPRNHVMSYLLELYVRFLTGISTSEYDMYVDQTGAPKFTAEQFFVNAAADHAMTAAGAVQDLGTVGFGAVTQVKAVPPPFNANIPNAAKQGVVNSSLNQIYTKASPKISGNALPVETAKKAKTVYSDNLAESRRLFLPKLFDRIFTVAVDPDDYEIDTKETLATASGREAFEKLLKQGMIEQIVDQSTFFASALASPRYRLRERDIKENDLTFEKYFVTFDTVFDEVV